MISINYLRTIAPQEVIIKNPNFLNLPETSNFAKITSKYKVDISPPEI